ncbi:hypothetical protein MTO96_027315 [Rhipicephalus appendiculatus]
MTSPEAPFKPASPFAVPLSATAPDELTTTSSPLSSSTTRQPALGGHASTRCRFFVSDDKRPGVFFGVDVHRVRHAWTILVLRHCPDRRMVASNEKISEDSFEVKYG